MPTPIEIYVETRRRLLCRSDACLPRAAIGFTGVDDGVAANPKFLRPTLTAIGTDSGMMKKAGIPFGAALSPLYNPLADEEQVPVVASAEGGRPPVRCHRCRGYICSRSVFTDMGRQWTCLLCGSSNPVEEHYFCPLTSDGYRLDANQRAELCRAAVEWDVSDYADYAQCNAAGTPMTPARPLPYLFLIDVSAHACQVFLEDYIYAVRESLLVLRRVSPDSPVSVLLYASQVHVCDFRQPRMPLLSVTDTAVPFVPLPFQSRCWLHLVHDWDIIETFLGGLMEMAYMINESGCVMGAAVETAIQVLGSQPGGRVVMCGHRFPRSGTGSDPAPRDYVKLYGSSKEKELFHPMGNSLWAQWGPHAADAQVSFDFTFFSQEYLEFATLSNLSHVTGGTARLIQRYERGEAGRQRLATMLSSRCEEETGYAGILRVRCSNGLRVRQYRGHYNARSAVDMDLAAVTARSTFYVELQHEGRVEKSDSDRTMAHIQMALLYTTRTGQRRVRVVNTPLTVTDDFSILFQHADLESCLYSVVTEAVGAAFNHGPEAGRKAAAEASRLMCVGYEKYGLTAKGTRQNYGPATLRLPSSLKHLPVLSLCLQKSDALCEGTGIPIDRRVFLLHHLLSVPIPELLPFIYPDLFALHLMVSNPHIGTRVGSAGAAGGAEEDIQLPPRRSLENTSILKTGVYALVDDSSEVVYVWIGSAVTPEVSQHLFGTPDAASVAANHGMGSLQQQQQQYSMTGTENAMADQWLHQCHPELQTVLLTLSTRGQVSRSIVVLHEGDVMEDALFRLLRCEGGVNGQSYPQCLQKLQRDVRFAMS